MDYYRNKNNIKYHFSHEKEYVNKNWTEINLKNFSHETGFSKKSKELH